MADSTPRTGRLIAVEGTRGADVAAEALTMAERLQRRGVPCGISRWDASGLFNDLLLAEGDQIVLSPRMLVLLFAADLMFRLRWEIRPGLAEGRVIIAAPYVHTAIAVAAGLGLDPAWTSDVMRFARPADIVRPTRERKRARGWRPRPARGYGEFCAAVLGNGPVRAAKRQARAAAIEWLESAAATADAPRRRVLVERIVEAVAAAPPSPAAQ